MKLNKIFKWGLVALILISVALLVWGFAVGFESNDAQAVEVLLYWAYAMLGITLLASIVINGIVSASNNPKFLVKVGIILVGAAAICFVAYLLASGDPAFGREGLDPASTLKLTDTILNLIYITGVGAIVAIIVGEIRLAIVNRK